jgi:hypothetical protein
MSDATLNTLLLKVARRAENAPADTLRDAFVPVRSLMAHLESPEHHILFGRRGTGKTHLLRYLQDHMAAQGALTIYLDLRKIGSPEDIVSAQQGSFAEQATNLLVDVVEHIHNRIFQQIMEDDRWTDLLDKISDALDALGDAATQIRVVGETEVEEQRDASTQTERSHGGELSVGRDAHAAWKAESRTQHARSRSERKLSRGHETHHVLLGPLTGAIQAVAEALAPSQLWLLIDEWSALPPELQPLMADLLRRTFFATGGVVVKISAIHGRSRFSDTGVSGALIGLEPGADTAASLDLDDFLLFRNDVASTLDFYATLLHRHLSAMAARADRAERLSMRGLDTPERLVARLFSPPESFHHLVLGAEGVPRDALQIAGLAAGAAYNQPIGSMHVAAATRDFFLRDKEGHLAKGPQRVFNRLIEQCSRQRSRIIPLRRDGESNEEVIQRLYDARLIHRVRQGVSLDPQHPAEVYDVYVIDYGCFLGLLKAGRIRTIEDGLDPGARFADANEIEIRGRTFVRLPLGWYRQPEGPRGRPWPTNR